MVYLAALVFSLVFFGFYKEWFSCIALLAVIFLPVLSLLMSLPAMLTVKADLRCPVKSTVDMPVRLSLQLKCPLPTPPVRCILRIVNDLTGERYLGKPGERLPTEHCGRITVSYPEMYVYDYLGLFRRRLKREETCTVYIMPKPVAAARLPKPGGKAMNLWRPKPGGGFSELHDLRLYRPGDDLRQIHWKMSAKVGKLIYREPLEPVQKGCLLTVSLSGDPQTLNTKLGQLLWTSHALLEQQMEHEVQCLTGKGILTFEVGSEQDLEACLQTLLGAQLTQSDSKPENQALWQQHIGGGTHEA